MVGALRGAPAELARTARYCMEQVSSQYPAVMILSPCPLPLGAASFRGSLLGYFTPKLARE